MISILLWPMELCRNDFRKIYGGNNYGRFNNAKSYIVMIGNEDVSRMV